MEENVPSGNSQLANIPHSADGQGWEAPLWIPVLPCGSSAKVNI